MILIIHLLSIFLINKDVNFIREAFPDTDSGFYAQPEYYGIFDDTL